MKDTRKFSEEYLETYLTSFAEIKNFYILKEGLEDKGGLMHYLAEDGAIYMCGEDDDDLAMACVQFLEKRGVRVFLDVKSIKVYEEELMDR